MWEFGESVLDAILDLQTDAVVGAIVFGLLQSIALAGAYIYLRRKVSDILPLLVGLMLIVSVSSMAIALGHARHEAGNRITHTTYDGPHRGRPGSQGHNPPGYIAAGFASPSWGALPPPWAWGFGPPPWVLSFYPTPLRHSGGPDWGRRPPQRPRPSEPRRGPRSNPATAVEDGTRLGHVDSSSLPLR